LPLGYCLSHHGVPLKRTYSLFCELIVDALNGKVRQAVCTSEP
jgi:hypothetical protein